MAISYSVYVAYAGLRMSTQDERVPMTSTLPCKMKIQYLITLQVSRYCPLVLQSCNVAAVPVIEHRVKRCLSCVSALHIWMARDAADIQKLLCRGAGVFQVIRGLKSKLVLYMASHYTLGYTVAQSTINKYSKLYQYALFVLKDIY